MHQSFVSPWVTPPGKVGKMWGFYIDFTKKSRPTGRGNWQILHPLPHLTLGQNTGFYAPWGGDFTRFSHGISKLLW